MESLLLLFFSAVIINNVILTKFLGLCPFFGISKDLKAAFSMGLAVIFVMTLASVATWLISSYILVPYSLEFLQTKNKYQKTILTTIRSSNTQI